MSEIKNYKWDFIQRTLELLTENFEQLKEKDKEVTFLLNCFLGLVVLTCENEKKESSVFKGKIDDEFCKVIPKKVKILSGDIPGEKKHLIDEINLKQLKKMDKLWFLKKIRNGISHQHIDGLNAEGKWIGIKLWNINRHGKIDFEIEFKIGELKDFAKFIAKKFLNDEKT